MKPLAEVLYDINDLVQSLIEDYDTSGMGSEFDENLAQLDRAITTMCIISDVEKAS